MSVSRAADLRQFVKASPPLRAIALALLRAIDAVRRPRKFLVSCYYRLRLKHCGRAVDFETGMVIRNPGKISIGDRCTFSPFVVLDAHDTITIGTDCMFAVKSTIATATHDYAHEIMNQRSITKPVAIGNNVWVGAGATILPGITVGDGAVIGAHALVTKDVPANAIVTGVPARVIRYREVKTAGGERNGG